MPSLFIMQTDYKISRYYSYHYLGGMFQILFSCRHLSDKSEFVVLKHINPLSKEKNKSMLNRHVD